LKLTSEKLGKKRFNAGEKVGKLHVEKASSSIFIQRLILATTSWTQNYLEQISMKEKLLNDTGFIKDGQ